VGKYLVDVIEADVDFPAGLGLISGKAGALTQPPTGGVHPVTISAAGSSYTAAIFGYNHSGQINGVVFEDSNRNGSQGSGESALGSVQVLLYGDANANGLLDLANGDYQTASALTSGAGAYTFSNLPAGRYLVQVYADSITGLSADPVPTTTPLIVKTLAAAETFTANFGFYAGARIEGNVFWDDNRNGIFDTIEDGLSPVSVTLTNFGGNGVLGGGDDTSVTAPTDSAGHFVFVEPVGRYQLSYSMVSVSAVNPALTDRTTTETYVFEARGGEDWQPVFNFGVDRGGKVGGTLFADLDRSGAQNGAEGGLADVAVALYRDSNNDNRFDAGDTFLDTRNTAADGSYQFSGLDDGNYVVQVITSTLSGGYTATPTATPGTEYVSGSEAGATVTAGGTVSDRNFGYPSSAVPPTNSLPATQGVSEDTNLEFKSANSNVLSVSDADGDLATVKLTVLNGTVTVTLGSSGATISAGASGTTTLTLSGSQTQINAALATLVYRGALNYNGTDTLTVLSTDGAGGTDTDNLTINVSAMNDAPVLDLDSNNSSTATGANYSASHTPGGPATAVADADAGITDVDDTNMESATIVLTNAKSGDTLSVGTLPSGSGSLTRASGETVGVYAIGQGTLGNSNYIITFVAANLKIANASALKGDGTKTGLALAEATYVEGTLPVLVAPLLALTEADSGQNYASAKITITSGAQTGDRLIFPSTPGITATFGTDQSTGKPVLTLTGTASLATYENALKGIRFDSLQNPTDQDRTLVFTVTDGDGLEANGSGTVHVRELVLSPNPNNVSIVAEDEGGPIGVIESEETGALRDLKFRGGPVIDGEIVDMAASITANPNVRVHVSFVSSPLNDSDQPTGKLWYTTGGTAGIVTPTPAAPLQLDFDQLASGVLRFIPEPDEYGVRYAKMNYFIEVLAGNTVLARSATNPAAILYFAVRNVNDAPVGQPVANLSLYQGQSYVIDLNGLFSEKDREDVGKLRFAATPVDASTSAIISGSLARITAASAVPGSTTVVLTATDPASEVTPISLNVNMRGVPTGPNALPVSLYTSAAQGDVITRSGSAITVSILEGRGAIIKLSATDPDQDPLSYSLSGPDAALFYISVPLGSSPIVNSLRPLDYDKPTDVGFNNVYNFSIIFDDGRGGVVTDSVVLTVLRDANKAPAEQPVQVPGSTTYTVAGGPVRLGMPTNSSRFNNIIVNGNGTTTVISVDDDADGVDDFTEAFAGDLNGDNIPDNLQNTVASFPGPKSDLGDTATYFSIDSSTAVNPPAPLPPRNAYMDALAATAPAGLSAAVKVGDTGVTELTPAQRTAWRQMFNQTALASNKEVTDFTMPIGVIGFSLKPEIVITGSPTPAERVAFEQQVVAAFKTAQNQVRVVLPKGSIVNTYLKFDAQGRPYDFAKAPIPNTTPTLYTGAEFFYNPDGTTKEAVIYFVDNARGDDDPTPGSINDPGSFAFISLRGQATPVTTGIANRSGVDGAGMAFGTAGSFSDPNGRSLTFGAAGLPPGLSIDPASGLISGALGNLASAQSPYTVTVAASNGVASVSSSFTITVINLAPVARDDAFNVTAGEAVSGSVAGNDFDQDADLPLIFVALSQPARGALSFNPDGSFTYRATGTAAGTAEFTYRLTDSQGASATARVTFTIAAVVVPPPVATTIPVQNAVDATEFRLNVGSYFTAAPGMILTFAASGLPEGLSIDPASGVITGRLDHLASRSGPYAVTITVRDTAGNVTQTTFILNVSNPAPVARDDAFAAANTATITGDVSRNDEDPDGDTPLRFALATPPQHGTVALRPDGVFAFSTTPGYFGPDEFTYTLTDAQGAQATAKVTLSLFAPPLNVLLADTFELTGAAQVLVRDGKPLVQTTDPDSPELLVVLSVGSGYLSLPQASGVMVVSGAGLNDQLLVLRGRVAALNAALATVVYQSASGSAVRDLLTITTTDETGLSDRDEMVLRTTVALLAGDTVSLTTPETTAAVAAGGSIRIKSYDPTLLGQVALKPGVADVSFEITAVNRWDGINQPTTVVIEITSADGKVTLVTIPVMVYHPKFEVLGPLKLNPETSLYEQRVRILNTTPLELPRTRVIVPALPAGVSLYTAHGTSGSGEVYIESPGRMAPNAESVFVLEFFSDNVIAFAQPAYTPAFGQKVGSSSGLGTVVQVGRVISASDRTYVEFPTETGRIYWIQYRDASNLPWQTSPIAIVGTGYTIQWLDDGWPKTNPAPTSGRAYQLLMAVAPSGMLQIVEQPKSQEVPADGTATLRVGVRTSRLQSLSYQWYKDGRAITSGVADQLVIPVAGASAVGDYFVVVSDGSVAVQSVSASLRLIGATAGRVINVSVLATLQAEQTLIAGVAIAGAPALRVLTRAIGPTLEEFKVPQSSRDTDLKLFSGSGLLLATNEDWGQDLAGPIISEVGRAVGAFVLPNGSRDAALVRSLVPGAYTMHTQNRTSQPTAVLTEVYDAGTEGSSRLVNISSRTEVGRNGAALTAGFVIRGDQPCRVLIRGVGPGLARFGVTGVLADPVITLQRTFDGSVVDTNDNWATVESQVLGEKLFERTGAFDLSRGSQDAVLVARLPAGGYTITVNAKGAAVGEALVEVYVVE
jgi:hypothetical protein